MEKQLIKTEIRQLEGKRKIKALVNDYKLSKELSGRNGKFREIIPKDVWTRAIANADNVNVFINHSPYVDIMEDMELRAESDGVYLYGTLLDNAEGVYKAIQKGTINGMSFGFKAISDEFRAKDGYMQRTIKDMKLLEVSLLDVEPAYHNTQVSVRSLELPVCPSSIKEKQLILYSLM